MVKATLGYLNSDWRLSFLLTGSCPLVGTVSTFPVLQFHVPSMFFLIFSLLVPFFLGAFAGKTHGFTHAPYLRHARLVPRDCDNFGKTYNMTDYYHGETFLTYIVSLRTPLLPHAHYLSLSDWDFFTEDDPTHGNVRYQSKSDAVSKGLAFVQDDGTTVLAVDDKSFLPVAGKRDS